jgi:anti-sigma B factor antagonist
MSLNVNVKTIGNEVFIILAGQLDSAAAPSFRAAVEEVFAQPEKPQKLIIVMDDLEYLASAGLRDLLFAKQKAGAEVPLVLSGMRDEVRETIEMTGFQYSVEVVKSYA